MRNNYDRINKGDAVAELRAKCADFLAGRFSRLTTEEIAEFCEAQEDPNGKTWEMEHAGEPVGVEPLELNGFMFVESPVGMSLDECRAVLRRIAGGRALTPDRLWWIARHGLIEKEAAHDAK